MSLLRHPHSGYPAPAFPPAERVPDLVFVISLTEVETGIGVDTGRDGQKDARGKMRRDTAIRVEDSVP
jgi:hypothetical protein